MNSIPQSWEGQRVSILGLARSGLALARVLTAKGARVLLSDQRAPEQLGDMPEQARALGAEVEMGGHSDRLLEGDVLLISPGVSIYAPVVQQALERGVAVAGEVEVAYRLCPKPLLAVTGTNGKSTSCSLLQQALGSRSRLAGNIGIPLVSEVSGDLTGIDFVVAEISSFQLETVHSFRPHLALLTNVTADHLDRHRTMEEYVESKARLFAYQTGDDWALFNADDAEARRVGEWVAQGKLPLWPHYPPPRRSHAKLLQYSVQHEVEHGAWLQDGWFWLRLPGDEARKVLRWHFPNLPGPHNLSNALAACLAALCVGASSEQIEHAFASYHRMHHRLEEVGALEGVRFIDDSKATNVSSVESALLTYEEPVVLIAGGRDKGLNLDDLGRVIARHCHALVSIGEAGPQIAEHALKYGLKAHQRASSMEEAVELAHSLAPRPGVVLLSPACTSFDMFLNAEHRGEVFAASASRLMEKMEER
ncbi:MAG: UDP-N-acetylmuramoyl-L-alanine--D-glutamate ligase [Candidatus Eremiobacteraeota bacterium]|nr:UDP-N-acetylmuramoyl-L-alanine--D-glutamate ligase [Candidatus Eremiobacteraeota bacterium]MCW5870247.1 UDP-N-acetylmuramoyl-L-alanine--D-glutamate ligase [Candidatus Eremiobacteraeota bacterium]